MIGIDEVGRGAWAGPLLVVAAKADSKLPSNLNDSKVLTKLQRNDHSELLKTICKFGEGWVEPHEIDAVGLAKAMRIGVSRALISLGAKFDEEIIMDGNVNYCPAEFKRVNTVVKADALHPIVSAASIYAKVLRDEHMVRAAKFYPFYGFEKHVGYGTQLHRSLLRLHGVSKLHRKSYKPVAACL